MKLRLLILITVGWFFVNLGWAAPPFPVPAKGGLPACQAELAACEANAQKLPATGQTTCWDSTGAVIDCAGTGQGQDGDIRAGAVLSYTDTGLTIIDNNTKLEWMKQDDNGGDCASDPGYLDKDCLFTWDEAFTFVASLNAACHGGHADWRVPNEKELQSIVNYQSGLPAVSSPEFNTGCVAGCMLETCSCTAANGYWSSTSFVFTPDEAWLVFFNDGNAVSVGKGIGRRVRAVRGGL